MRSAWLGAHIGGQPRLHRGAAAQRLRPRPERRRPAGRPGHVPRGGFTATGTGEDGAVRLVGAHIGGQLDCNGASLRNDSGPALIADSLQVDQDMFLTRRVHRHRQRRGRRGPPGRRPHRRPARLHRGELRNDSGPALIADGLQVDQDMYLSGGFTATGSGDDGAVRLAGAHIGGQLDCTGATCATTPAPP